MVSTDLRLGRTKDHKRNPLELDALFIFASHMWVMGQFLPGSPNRKFVPCKHCTLKFLKSSISKPGFGGCGKAGIAIKSVPSSRSLWEEIEVILEKHEWSSWPPSKRVFEQSAPYLSYLIFENEDRTRPTSQPLLNTRRAEDFVKGARNIAIQNYAGLVDWLAEWKERAMGGENRTYVLRSSVNL